MGKGGEGAVGGKGGGSVHVNSEQYPREEGGLNLPNLEYYHHAAQMFFIDHIINNANESSWIDIENHQLMPKNYLSIIFSSQKGITANFIINSTLNAWKKNRKANRTWNWNSKTYTNMEQRNMLIKGTKT